jgi:hypothetical protein
MLSEMSVISTTNIPKVVHTNDDYNKNQSENIEGISDDSKLSYSPSDKSNMNSNKEINRIGKNAQRTEELKNQYPIFANKKYKQK